MNMPDLQILYEDNHLLAVFKPAGLLTQGDKTGDISLLELTKQWLIEKYHKPGKAFLGMMHRLDRPVAGVVLFAKTSKAANRLSLQFRARTVQKSYLAVLQGLVTPESGRLRHYIRKRPGNRRVQIARQPFEDAQNAELRYTVLEYADGNSLVYVRLHTGRHHQIRAQFSAIGHPILGDRKYRSAITFSDKNLALFAFQLIVKHPTLDTDITLQASLPDIPPWTLFHTRHSVDDLTIPHCP